MMLGCDVQYTTSKRNVGNRGRRLWIIHDEEVKEGPNTAEAVARGLAISDRRASIQACVDRNSIAGQVGWDDTAWHAGNSAANWCSVGVEHDGYAHQSREEWLDEENGVHTLERSAKLFREVGMQRYGYEPRILAGNLTAVRNIIVNGRHTEGGQTWLSGVCGHRDVTYAMGVKGGHTDPGEHFPYDTWLKWALDGVEPPPKPAPPVPFIYKENPVGNPATKANPDGRLELFYISPVGDLWHSWQTTPNGPWAPLEPIDTPNKERLDPNNGVTLDEDEDGRLEAFVSLGMDPAGGVFHTWQLSVNGTKGWSKLAKMA
jgi:hypothetical protein